jgi:hypothetical protein
VVVEDTAGELWAYRPCIEFYDVRTTRGQSHYARVGTWSGCSPKDMQPISVVQLEDGILHQASGPPLYQLVQTDANTFWDYMWQWAGDWMWENIYTPYGIDAVEKAIASGSAVYVTDGSYSRKIRSDIDGAGWVVYCKAQKKIVLKGSFYEWCIKAGSYRGELVGLLAVHLLVKGVEEFYNLGDGLQGLVGCDNLGGLNKSKERRRKIRSGAKHADVLRALRRAHDGMKGTLTYQR